MGRWHYNSNSNSAPPLIALPGTSPRKVTGRRTLSLTISLIFDVARKSGGGAICLFSPSLYGEKMAAAG
ncbi:hypothetical protein BQ8482_350149 [Mesorhizobium delmotii]|uniref:Uncharacterized protein n=1 Tax=Mesorhizobium delmotii TaxID=1631247 RepID=A0A2P9AQS9_9HYPH|nr:hypothetical protein BQ8482_350149 [Mesorhizobium delmotii]